MPAQRVQEEHGAAVRLQQHLSAVRVWAVQSSVSVETCHPETIPETNQKQFSPRKQDCSRVLFSPEEFVSISGELRKARRPFCYGVYSTCTCVKSSRKPSPEMPTLLAGSSAVQGRTEEAFINIFQPTPGKQRHPCCWVLQRQEGSAVSFRRLLVSHLLDLRVLLDGKCKSKLLFILIFVIFFLSHPPHQARKLVLTLKRKQTKAAQEDQIARQSKQTADTREPRRKPKHILKLELPSLPCQSHYLHPEGVRFIFAQERGI